MLAWFEQNIPGEWIVTWSHKGKIVLHSYEMSMIRKKCLFCRWSPVSSRSETLCATVAGPGLQEIVQIWPPYFLWRFYQSLSSHSLGLIHAAFPQFPQNTFSFQLRFIWGTHTIGQIECKVEGNRKYLRKKLLNVFSFEFLKQI